MKLFRKTITGLGIITALVLGGGAMLFGLPGTGWKAMTVPTGSMTPNIPVGSVVFVHSVPTSSLKIGDVITYASMQTRNKTVTHRITQNYVAGGRVPGFITKGDANKVADAPIVAGQVKGRVIASVPYLGKISKLLLSWPVIIALVYLPSVLVMIEEIKRLTAYYKTLLPYKVAAIIARERAEAKSNFGVTAVPIISLLLIAASVVFALPVQAMFKSNSVKLNNNNLIVTVPPIPPTTCSNTNTTNSTNITVTGTTTQTATTGSANNAGNTNGGTATSGNATNNNNSSTTITIVNGC